MLRQLVRRSFAPSLAFLLLLALASSFHQSERGAAIVAALQHAAPPSAEHEPAAGPQAAGQNGAPMLTMSGETSSNIESVAALNSDDLIAAESSQAPADAQAAEHKAFTSAQMLRQDAVQQQQQQQQHMASVAPIFVGASPQQQQQQQQQQQAAASQQQGAFPQAHLGPARIQPPHKANFNPFMAAALAGNYGPAQQQIAAAALHAQQQGGQVGPPHHHAHLHHVPHHAQQQVHAHAGAQHHPQQHPAAAHLHAQQQHHHHPHQQQVHSASVPQQHQLIAAQQAAAAAAAGQLVVQESSVRHNVVPAPSSNQFIAADSNGPDVGELVPAQQQQQQQAIAAQQTGLVAASSAPHAVVATANSPASGSASLAGIGSASGAEAQSWPLQAPDIPKIVNLEVKCEKNLMKVSVEFDKVFNGVVFSKGHFNHGQCVHVGPNSNKQQAYFDISINSCGTQGNTQNGLYGMGQNTGSGTFFENTIVIQYDPNVQEVYDHARKLRCTWHDQYEKAVTFRPFPVDMLDIVRADFAGDNVGCWMQIQVGKGPWASEVAGIVKIGQTMTMVLAIKDEENKFDMLVRNCFAHDGKRGPIELVDKSGCITRPKLMSRFTKIKNFGSSATVLSYAHFQAFKFPDSMEVHFQCTIQICRHQCPEQCVAGPNVIGGSASSPSSSSSATNGEAYSESTISGTFSLNGNGNGQSNGNQDSMHLRKYGAAALSRERRDVGGAHRSWSNGSHHHHQHGSKPLTQTVGLNRIIQVVSTGDLAFAVRGGNGAGNGEQQQQSLIEQPEASQLTRVDLINGNQICMSSYNFVLALVMLVLVMLCSCLLAVSLYVRQRSFLAAAGGKKQLLKQQHMARNSRPFSGDDASSTNDSPQTRSTLSKLFASFASSSATHHNHNHHHHHQQQQQHNIKQSGKSPQANQAHNQHHHQHHHQSHLNQHVPTSNQHQQPGQMFASPTASPHPTMGQAYYQ